MTRRTDDPLVIDADAHILEPPDLWQRYIDPAFRDRPICIKTDARGLEYLEIDGKMSKRNSGGMLFTVGGYGKSPRELMPRPDRTYAGTAPLGAMDPRERLTYMDQEGVDASVLYPLWPCCGNPRSLTPPCATPTVGPITAGSSISAPTPPTG